MPIPFRGQLVQVGRPDGSTMSARCFGDQYFRRFENLDGYTICMNAETGRIEFAERDPRGRLVASGHCCSGSNPVDLKLEKHIAPTKEAFRRIREVAKLPGIRRRADVRRLERRIAVREAVLTNTPLALPDAVVGQQWGLCLPIDFPDARHSIPIAQLEDLCNSENTRPEGSLYDYLYANSDDKLEFKNLIAPRYYTAKHDTSYYQDPSIPSGCRSAELVTEALKYWVDDGGIDFKLLTTDSQQTVKSIAGIYSVPWLANPNDGLFPLAWSLADYLEVAADVWAYDYQVTNLRLYENEQRPDLPLYTLAHETCHVLCDFNDLYDTDDGEYGGIGSFGLMSYPAYVGAAEPWSEYPTEVCGYHKFKAGWASNVIEARSGETVTLSAERNEFLIHRRNAAEWRSACKTDPPRGADRRVKWTHRSGLANLLALPAYSRARDAYGGGLRSDTACSSRWHEHSGNCSNVSSFAAQDSEDSAWR